MKIDPDVTINTLRSLLEASQPVPKSALRFLWPSPPYYKAIDTGDQPDEECLLIFKDGTRATGTLLNFLPDDALLKFRQVEESSSVNIGFGELLWMQLLRPVSLWREALSLGTAQEFSFAPSDFQPFSVQLMNGQTFQGKTIGYVHALCGMFLFLPENGNKVIRCFVPEQSGQTSNIGKPIGQMLVDQHLASAEAVGAALEKQLAMRTRRLGEYLTGNQIVSQEQLAAALKQQRVQPVQKLGETLVDLGYITQVELDEALAMEARNRSLPLGQILTDMGVVDADVIQSLMAKKLGIPFVNLRSLTISPEVLKRPGRRPGPGPGALCRRALRRQRGEAHHLLRAARPDRRARLQLAAAAPGRAGARARPAAFGAQADRRRGRAHRPGEQGVPAGDASCRMCSPTRARWRRPCRRARRR